MHDEGYILHAAQRFLQGDIPYRDFHFIYTPATIFATAFGFKIFGENILSGRILALLIAIVTSFIIYKITNQLTNNKLTSFISLLIFLSWGPSHINFPWPVVFAFPLGLIIIYLLTRHYSSLHFVTIGMMAGIVFLFKQNFGLAVFLTVFVYLLFAKDINRKKPFFLILLGAAFIAVLFVLWLIKTNAFMSFGMEFYEYSIIKIILEEKFTTGFPSEFPKLIIYLFPGLISLAALGISWGKRGGAFFGFSLFSLLFYIFGIWPIADYPHLVYLLATIGIPLAILINQSKGHSRIHNIMYIIVVSLIIVGIYTALYKKYYRWETPLIRQTHFIPDKRVRIFTDEKYKRVIEVMSKEVQRYTKKDESIFVFYRAPLIYFITNRRNPTKYIDFSPESLPQKEQKQVIGDLKKSNVLMIITHDLPSAGNEYIQKYIKSNFRQVKNVYEYGVWFRL